MVKGLFVGLSVLDVIHYARKTPGPDEKVRALETLMYGGGPALNAAVAFAALTRSRTVLETRLGGATGGFVYDDLVRHSVEVVSHGGGDTPVVSIVVTEETNQRSVVSSGDGTDRVFREEGDLRSDPAEFDVVVVDGYNIDLAMAAARKAKEAGVPLIFGAGGVCPSTSGLVELSDIAIVSSSFLPEEAETALDVLHWLHRHSTRYAVVTDGEDPIMFSDSKTGVFSRPAHPSLSVDTLGAGDIFRGAAAAYVAAARSSGEELNIGMCLDYAAMIAAHSVNTRGTRAWIADLEGEEPEQR